MHFLTKYLDKLVNTKSKEMDVIANRDFIALLINSYIKLGKIDKINELIKTHSLTFQSTTHREVDPIFNDIRIIIESCR